MSAFVRFLFILCSLCALQAKDPLQFLINKFEKKIDTNIYYLLNFERQKNEPHYCNSADGPYCTFLNDRALGAEVIETAETAKLKQNVKANAKNWIDQLLSPIRKKESQGGIFYYFDQMRDNLDQMYEQTGQFSGVPSSSSAIPEINSNPMTKIEVFLDFDNLPPEPKEKFLDVSFKVAIGTTLTPKSSEEFLLTNFQGFFIPPKEMVNFKKSSKNKDILEETSAIVPEGIYVYTNDKDGSMGFSKPVKMRSIYLRKHNFAKYKAEKTNPRDPTRFYLQGYKKEKLVFDIEITSSNPSFNPWVQVIFSETYEMVDNVVFEPNTDLDNVNFIIADDNILPEFTTEDIESIFEGIEEEDEEFRLRQENSDEMSVFEQVAKENAQKTKPPASKTNVFNEKGPKGGQRPPQTNNKNPQYQKQQKRQPTRHNTQQTSKTSIPNQDFQKDFENPAKQLFNEIRKDQENPTKYQQHQRINDPPQETNTKTINEPTKKSRTTDEVFREIMDIVEILNEDEEQLEKSFEMLKEMDAEQFRKRMRVYFKEFPEFEEHLTKNLQNSESLSELLDRMEEKYPEFKAVFKDSLIQEKLSQRSSDEEPEKKQPFKK